MNRGGENACCSMRKDQTGQEIRMFAKKVPPLRNGVLRVLVKRPNDRTQTLALRLGMARSRLYARISFTTRPWTSVRR